MGELLLCPKLPDQMADAVFTAGGVVTVFLQKLCGSIGFQVPAQSGGTVKIDQGLFLRKPKGKQAQSLSGKPLIYLPDRIQQGFSAVKRTGEQAACLDSGKGRCAISDEIVF